MKIAGQTHLDASPEQVWEAIHDPAVLARCLPGCESLTQTGEHQYDMTVTAGVAAVKGTYDGTVALHDPEPPGAFTMRAHGVGSPGTVDADVRVVLSPGADGGTDLSYDADAALGGMIGGVGQRMLTSASKKMAGQFFLAVDQHLSGEGVAPAALLAEAPGPVGEAARVAEPGGLGATGAPDRAPVGTPATGVGTVYPGRTAYREPGERRMRDFALGVAVGGLVAIAGVIVGGVIGGR
jgi:carbon monoxide dehydrogenase subunit G